VGLTANASARRAERLLTEDLLAEFLEETPGPVISENLTALVQAGKPVLLEPATFTQLIYTGRWDAAPLIAMIREKRFGAVVARSGTETWCTPEIMREIKTACRRAMSIGADYVVYLP
jgi:hypothetical protein